MEQVQYLADVFWRRWIPEYLPTLQERRKWGNASRNFAVNDVVLVLDDRVPRCSWPFVQVYMNKRDGIVRSAQVKTNTSVLVRKIDEIVLLEAA